LWLEIVGTTSASFDPVLYLETHAATKKLPPIDWPSLHARRKARMAELIDAQPIRPGVAEMIYAAADSGLRLAVASSSGRAWVASHLERRKLLPHFDAVCTGDEVERVKPDPALYRLALKRLGVEPHHALAVEDSRNGMLAAKGAGLRCVVTPNAITG
jgi:HAD superfamily hydrolase (TIGR01509 family)